MFERYTEAARRTLFFARYEASQFGSLAIEAEHLLLGLFRDRPSWVMEELLAGTNVSVERIRVEVERVLVKSAEKVAISVEIPFSKDAKQILSDAAAEADLLQSSAIDVEHLLLGILRNEHTRAASILMGLGLHLEEVRQELVRLQKEAARKQRERDARVGAQVRIVPAKHPDRGTVTRGRPAALEMNGFTVRAALSRVCGVDESRIEMLAPIDEQQRYDFSAVWSPNDSYQTGEGLIQEGIKHHFQVAIEFEKRSMDVYVLTAPNGTSASMTEMVDLGGGGISFSTVDFMTTGSLDQPRLDVGAVVTDLSASNATMAEFCHMLEPVLDSLVVDETQLEGRFDFRVHGHAPSVDELRALLLAQTRLVLTPARREVMMLIVRPM